MRTKHLIGFCLLSLLCAVGFTACDEIETEGDNMIWDFAPIELYIAVQDAEGNDLLNPDTPGNIANQGIKAIYKETIYEKDAPVSQTKAYMPHFRGLQTIKSKEGVYILTFGEFAGDKTFDNEQVIIDWNDGTKDVITFSNKLSWKSKNEPVIDRTFNLNGKETEEQSAGFIITKAPAALPTTNGQYIVTDVRYGIDADNATEIEADLQQHLLYPAGSSFVLQMDNKISFEGDKGKFTWKNADSSIQKSGELTYVRGTGLGIPEEAKSFIKLQMPGSQIYSYLLWKVNFGNETSDYHILVVSKPSTKSSFAPSIDLWMYEDLTAYYQTKFPESNVKGVTRVFVSEYRKY